MMSSRYWPISFVISFVIIMILVHVTDSANMNFFAFFGMLAAICVTVDLAVDYIGNKYGNNKSTTI